MYNFFNKKDYFDYPNIFKLIIGLIYKFINKNLYIIKYLFLENLKNITFHIYF